MIAKIIPVKFGYPHLACSKPVEGKPKTFTRTSLEMIAISLAFAVGIIIGTVISQGMMGL